MTELRRLRETERWLAWIRLVGVPFAAFQVAVGTDYPPGYERWAWITTAVFAVGTVVIFWLARRNWSRPGPLAPRRARARFLGSVLRLRRGLHVHPDLQLRPGLAGPRDHLPPARRGRTAR